MLLIEKNYYFCIGRIKMNYNPRELGHKSSTIKKIFGRSATATGLAKQGSSPVQTAELNPNSLFINVLGFFH